MKQTAGTIAGRYELGKLLGEGRTGKVFRARDLKSQDRVAVKLLHKPLCSVPESVRRFAREFEATRLIDHPNVVRALDFGQQTSGSFDGTHYLVMELVEGKRLGDVLTGGAIAMDRAIHIGLGVARALAAAHEHGVVHRDVEPNNVLLQRVRGKEVFKVLDFGLARLTTGGDEALTDFGIRLGTVEYMSPEYVQTGELEPRSDVYALGVLLFAMLTGAPPFSGRTLTVMQAHATTAPPTLSARMPGVPPWIDAIVMEMLAKQPEHRPSSEEVVRRLEDNVASVEIEADRERRALAAFVAPPMPPPASVGHRSDVEGAVYPEPRARLGVPILLTVAMFGFAMVGMFGIGMIIALILLL